MDQYRSARPPGSLLELGGTVYRLEAVEGCGSSAVVYRATYRDQLNRDATHQVFLKELCPVCPQGGVRRGADGSVICEGPGRSVMEEAGLRFRTGKALVPFRITGNIEWGVPAPVIEGVEGRIIGRDRDRARLLVEAIAFTDEGLAGLAHGIQQRVTDACTRLLGTAGIEVRVRFLPSKTTIIAREVPDER